MKKIILIAAVAAVGLFCSWQAQSEKQISKAQWLLGTWENRTKKGSVYETWTKAGEDVFSGRSYMLKDKDTMVFENIRLVQEAGRLVYIPVVKEQNKGQAVRFELKSVSDNELVFENPAHDFPQLIRYTRITSDSLVAEISGTVKGSLRKQSFPMKRK